MLNSTGGDINENEVHPGVAIYFKGADIGAIVSTGNWTWKVEVLGQRPLAGTVVIIPHLKQSYLKKLGIKYFL